MKSLLPVLSSTAPYHGPLAYMLMIGIKPPVISSLTRHSIGGVFDILFSLAGVWIGAHQ